MTSFEDRPDERALRGLDTAAVEERRRAGLVNRVDERTSRRVGEIVRAHVVTRFNALLGAVAVAVLVTGRWQDALFVIVLVVNAAVGILQEWRAKRTLDALAIVHAPRATVIRDGLETVIDPGDIVSDDLVVLASGDQVVVDARVIESRDVELDESLLTGEADPVAKVPGDEVMSGSLVVAGGAVVQATAVGAQAYAHRLAVEARKFSLTSSELRAGTDQILKGISWVVVVLGPLLVIAEWGRAESWQDAVTSAASGVVGMVPEGLVLLTTLAFVVAVVGLARRDVLVQELAAVEGLARVDVVCLDKTGTLTQGTVSVGALEIAGHQDPDELGRALGAIAHGPDPNATTRALADAYGPPIDEGPGSWNRVAEIPFSSARKWSAVTLAGHGSWYLGAPDVLEPHAADPSGLVMRARHLASEGRRVVAVAHRMDSVDDRGDDDPARALAGITLVGLVVLDEQIREDAAETLSYLRSQGVSLKVISGDHPLTVTAVARRVGLEGLEETGAIVDARGLPNDPEALATILDAAVVLGRVAPHQKQAMVAALQSRGHVVAMTGDGVNDALALKSADLAIAMGSGAPASRAVAQLVLLDGRFSHLPRVLGEGRRVIANVERVATLFVMKNVMSALLSLVTILGVVTYPFLPRHMSLLSTVTIGIPAFVLALAPNAQLYRPGFVRRVLKRAIPFGVVMAASSLVAFAIAQGSTDTVDEARAATLVTATVVGLGILVSIARPLRWWKVVLIASMFALLALAIALPFSRDLFAVSMPISSAAQAFVVALVGLMGVAILARTQDRSATP